MATNKANRPTVDDDLDNFDVDDFADPFADSGDEDAKGKADTNPKKRKDASGLGIEEEVNVAKKPRVPNVKLDAPRLLSDKGIPKLRRKARELKFKGKGHEVRLPDVLALGFKGALLTSPCSSQIRRDYYPSTNSGSTTCSPRPSSSTPWP